MNLHDHGASNISTETVQAQQELVLVVEAPLQLDPLSPIGPGRDADPPLLREVAAPDDGQFMPARFEPHQLSGPGDKLAIGTTHLGAGGDGFDDQPARDLLKFLSRLTDQPRGHIAPGSGQEPSEGKVLPSERSKASWKTAS